MKLSIIIPVYNVEKYLCKCLDSCLNQDVKSSEYEVIAINDGSPDNCDQILGEYGKKYSNLKIITQKNQGLSCARNNGLSIAKGKYIWFVDSDDWIEANCLKKIFTTIEKDPDLIQIGFQYVWENTLQIQPSSYTTWNDIKTGAEAYLIDGIAVAAQFTIVRRELLINNKIIFYPHLLHEDVEYKPKIAILAKTCICHSEVVYNYLQRTTGNIMSNFKKKNALDLIVGCRSLIKFANHQNINNLQQKVIGNEIGRVMNTIFRNTSKFKPQDKDEIASEIRNSPDLYKWMLKSNRTKYQIEAMLLICNYNLGSIFYKVLASLHII